MKLSDKEIREIAELLDCGMICYIHKETKEIKSIMYPDDIYAERELWEEELEEIENNLEKYVRVDQMSSREAFQVMAAFAEQVSDKDARKRLIYALNRNKPFKNFKYEVDYNEEVRQSWFKFKADRYEEWVKSYLENVYDEEDGGKIYS